MACGCGQTNKQVFKVIAASGAAKEFSTYAQAQSEVKQNGGRIRVTYANQ